MTAGPTAATLAALVAAGDLEALGAHLTEDVRLRALLPTGPLEEHGRQAALARFEEWVGRHDPVVLEEASGELVGDRLLVHYRLGFTFVEGPHAMTQTWVSSVGVDGRIFRIDLLCSGYRRVAA